MTQVINQTQIDQLRNYARSNKYHHGEDYPLSGCSYSWYDCDGVIVLGVKFDGGITIDGDTYKGITFGAPRGHLTDYYRMPMPLTTEEAEANRIASENKEAGKAGRLQAAKQIASEFGDELRGLSGKQANERVKQIAAERGQTIYWNEVKMELAAN